MSPEPEDYYQTLGVPRKATLEEIKSAYRRQAFIYHPDVTRGSKEAGKRFMLIAEAYRTLSNRKLKATYDKKLSKPTPAVQSSPGQVCNTGYDPSPLRDVLKKIHISFGWRYREQLCEMAWGMIDKNPHLLPYAFQDILIAINLHGREDPVAGLLLPFLMNPRYITDKHIESFQEIMKSSIRPPHMMNLFKAFTRAKALYDKSGGLDYRYYDPYGLGKVQSSNFG